MGNASATRVSTYGQKPTWGAGRPRLGPLRLLISWIVATLALLIAAWIVPGANVNNF
jgi:hypothetical protein